MQDGVTLARQQSVDVQAARSSQFPEAVSFQFMGHEHFTLLERQFCQRRVHCFHQDGPGVGSIRPSLRRGQQVLQGGFLIRMRQHINQQFRLLLAEKVGDPVDSDAVHPGTDLLDRFGDAWRYWLAKNPEQFGKPLDETDKWPERYIKDSKTKSPEMAFWLNATPSAEIYETARVMTRSASKVKKR